MLLINCQAIFKIKNMYITNYIHISNNHIKITVKQF
jgi:hypothetical protein